MTINYVKVFNSIDDKHQIEISLLENIAWFNINKLNYESYKTFVLLLKDIISFLSKNNVTNIKQYVYKTDLKYFNNSSHICINDDKYIINTYITDFLPEIINALGIQKL